MALAFAGIQRQTEFSPNHVLNDLRIIQCTAAALERLGATVRLYDEGALATERIEEPFIFSMAQGPMGSAALLPYEEEGRLIINSPRAVMNCYRVNMTRLLTGAGIPFPRSRVVETGNGAVAAHGHGFTRTWVKRGDVHAVHKEDVTLAYSPDEVTSILSDYHRRGIQEAVLQEHLEGDTVKFYALHGNGFFDWYYLNGTRHTSFDITQLRRLAAASAEALGLFVYGGDAIVDPAGVITIIDINDWPSFARVREAASEHIAHLLLGKANDHVRERQ